MKKSRSTLKRFILWSLAILFSVWALVSVTVAPAFFVAVNSYAVDQDPGSRGLDFDDIEIESDGVVLAGWWIPAKKPIAELIFVHGAGSNRISAYVGSLDFYATLNELGISVIAMDLRNHGNSPITDARLHMGATEWADVLAAAQWLDKSQPTALPRFVLGASMGGSAVIRALREGLQVTGTILLDPQLGMLDSLIHGAKVVTGLPAPLFVLAAQTAIWQYELPAGSHSPLLQAAALQQPILLRTGQVARRIILEIAKDVVPIELRLSRNLIDRSADHGRQWHLCRTYGRVLRIPLGRNRHGQRRGRDR